MMINSLFQTPLLAEGSNIALATFGLYTLAVFVLAALSNRLLSKRSFLSEYFLGSRGLGVWAFALTFAATSASGGSFTGFPSKIYSHGWVLGLWIGSYMVVPICAMGLLGKRINQVARLSGAITVPDILRDRYNNAAFGILSVGLIVFFMSFNLVAQFKAGTLILQTLLQDVTYFHDAAALLSPTTSSIGWFDGVTPEYLLCLFAFGAAVIVYTTYGGFHAVVWTDVMQGVVMVVGVLFMLPLAIYLCGGLNKATDTMAKMTPPTPTVANVSIGNPANKRLTNGDWILWTDSAGSDRSKLATLNSNTETLSTMAATVCSILVNLVEIDCFCSRILYVANSAVSEVVGVLSQFTKHFFNLLEDTLHYLRLACDFQVVDVFGHDAK